jgi:hypothetical protein
MAVNGASRILILAVNDERLTAFKQSLPGGIHSHYRGDGFQPMASRSLTPCFQKLLVDNSYSSRSTC